MSISPFYPPKPCKVEDLKHHPAFRMMVKAQQQSGTSKDNSIFYELLRIATNPAKYSNGMSLFDWADECGSSTSCEGSVKELNRMNVFRLESEGPEHRLVPCDKLEAKIEAKVGRKMTSVYLPITLIDTWKSAAAERHLSMSAVAEAALLAYLAL